MKVLQLHKRSSYTFSAIQDKWAWNAQNNSFSLADGTTQSFRSELWSELVTNYFATHPTLDSRLIINGLKEQALLFKNKEYQLSSNHAKASLERAKQEKGGTSTFIGILFKGNDTIDVISCGDSNLFILKSKGENIYFPFSNADNLDDNKFFINTEQLLKDEVDEAFFKIKSLPYSSDDTLIVASDALSRLLLKKPDSIIELLAVENFDGLHEFCLKYWESNELEEDDISALIISKSKLSKVDIIIPPEDFSFPKEEEGEFVPNTGITEQLNEMQMSEIMNQFNGVARDFHIVKKKQQNHSILLVSLFVMMVVNLSLMLYIGFGMNRQEVDVLKTNSDMTKKESFMDVFKLRTIDNDTIQ